MGGGSENFDLSTQAGTPTETPAPLSNLIPLTHGVVYKAGSKERGCATPVILDPNSVGRDQNGSPTFAV